jgi:hypothetical protein
VRKQERKGGGEGKGGKEGEKVREEWRGRNTKIGSTESRI